MEVAREDVMEVASIIKTSMEENDAIANWQDKPDSCRAKFGEGKQVPLAAPTRASKFCRCRSSPSLLLSATNGTTAVRQQTPFPLR